MQIKRLCSYCDGSGQVSGGDPPVIHNCLPCSGVGYTTGDIIFPEHEEVMEKLAELKTKINQIQADVNYIKSKVG